MKNKIAALLSLVDGVSENLYLMKCRDMDATKEEMRMILKSLEECAAVAAIIIDQMPVEVTK